METIHQKEFKSILNQRKTIDSWFWDKYSINPYHGCHFNCLYCDSRSRKYHLHENFDTRIIVKDHIARQLDERLTRARTLEPDVVAIAGTTDPYQPAEKDYQNTRQCLEVLKKHHYPVHLCTKSPLILKDMELIESIAEKTWASVSVTITTLNQNTARFLEPEAPSPEQRLNIFKTIRKNYPHIQTGLLLMPVVPGITDRASDIRHLIQQASSAGAQYVLFGWGMTLRDRQAVHFLDTLRQHHPDLIPLYEEKYQFQDTPDSYNGKYTPSFSYLEKLKSVFYQSVKDYSIKRFIPRFIPDDERKTNYRIAELILNKVTLLQEKNEPWSGIKNYFWAAQNLHRMKEPFETVIQNPDLLNQVTKNKKLIKWMIKQTENF